MPENPSYEEIMARLQGSLLRNGDTLIVDSTVTFGEETVEEITDVQVVRREDAPYGLRKDGTPKKKPGPVAKDQRKDRGPKPVVVNDGHEVVQVPRRRRTDEQSTVKEEMALIEQRAARKAWRQERRERLGYGGEEIKLNRRRR